jgi:hypothetical protein
MTAALPIPTRVLVLIAAALALLAAVVVARPLVFSNDESNTPPLTQVRTAPTPTAPRTAKPAAPAKRLQLLPGLPGPLARELRFEKVVVVSVYAAKAPTDRTALAHARAGAREVGAGFVPVNVLDERKARALEKFLGVSDSPAVLVVRRPGRIITRIEGFVDSAIVAQAAQNAGAGKRGR